MNASLKGKLVAGFILAFLAGAVTGAFFTFHEGQQWHGSFGRHPHSVAERMRERVKSQLDLTPEQMVKVAPILDRAVKELQQIRSETGAKVRRVMSETDESLKPLLSDEQREKLARIEKEGHGKRGARHPGRRRSSRAAEPEANEPQD
ncbi:MAG TPA: hypothetical protein VH207_09050 [Chthoniobacterales bacterium]|jgi:hypothetical protein|nr:hypothetical protein [Chthoniobacterales bacterium]